MGLKAKFNLVMLAAFLAGLGLAGGFTWHFVHESARREVLQQAQLMMAQATAIRGYTDSQISPLLAEQNKIRFLPQSIPFYAAETNLRALTQQYPDYDYKEAALNPTNPADRATDWEAGIIDAFRRQPTLQTLTTTRETATGAVLSIARPVRVTDQSCLACHSTPQAAPPSMIDLYGSANGFGWKLGETVGAQIVSVPLQLALSRANETFAVLMGGLAVIFAATLLVLNLLLSSIVVRPVRRIAARAGEISTGNLDVAEFEVNGRDEIASLATSFNRMRRSLVSAMKLLDG
jgi:HAMP domain-containing protein